MFNKLFPNKITNMLLCSPETYATILQNDNLTKQITDTYGNCELQSNKYCLDNRLYHFDINGEINIIIITKDSND